jgi:hypothetical protein
MRTCLLSLSALILLAACASQPTPEPTIMPSHTPKPTPATTATPTPSPTDTYTPTATITFTPRATLSREDATLQIQKYLSNSPDCELPCWLGIIPGQSTRQDFWDQWAMLGFIAIRIYDSGEIALHFPEDNIGIEIDSGFSTYRGEGKITLINARTRANREIDGEWRGYVYGYPGYNELMHALSLPEILSRYGIPGNIYIRDTISRLAIYFTVYLQYPQRGISISYEMPAEGMEKWNEMTPDEFEDIYRFCPSKAFVDIVLIPSNLGAEYQDFIQGLSPTWDDYFFRPKYSKTPEEGLGITNEEFYERFRSLSEQCLEISSQTWWP